MGILTEEEKKRIAEEEEIRSQVHRKYEQKSSGVAGVLSTLCPGLGQVYNGQIGKASIFFFCFIVGLTVLSLGAVSIVKGPSSGSSFNVASGAGISEEKPVEMSEEGIVPEAARVLKSARPDILLITDVCLCAYTSHGHCGIIEGGRLRNDPTLELLAKTALSQVEAGADMVAPSDMMDGRVAAIRETLDEGGFQEIPIMSYAAKYASSFYGPFREAAESAPQFGDRKSYQMDPANTDEAMREIVLDLEEGADIIVVKPALAYLDVLWRAKQEFGMPMAAYSVSGEFAMIKAASRLGWLEEEKVMLEVLTSIRRAGADLIITYFAKEAARLLGA